MHELHLQNLEHLQTQQTQSLEDCEQPRRSSEAHSGQTLFLFPSLQHPEASHQCKLWFLYFHLCNVTSSTLKTKFSFKTHCLHKGHRQFNIILFEVTIKGP